MQKSLSLLALTLSLAAGPAFGQEHVHPQPGAAAEAQPTPANPNAGAALAETGMSGMMQMMQMMQRMMQGGATGMNAPIVIMVVPGMGMTMMPPAGMAMPGMQMPQRPQGANPPVSPTDYAREAAAANARMAAAMQHAPTDNPDHDFAMMMIPHHQGAIDMAQIELKYGKDPELRALATAIIAAQEAEIAQLKTWLARPMVH